MLKLLKVPFSPLSYSLCTHLHKIFILNIFFVLFQTLLQVEHLKDLSSHPACHYPQRQPNPSFFSQQFFCGNLFLSLPNFIRKHQLTFRKVFYWSCCSELHIGRFSFASTKNVLSLKDTKHMETSQIRT